tara:strand:- start:1435 stop:1614 length:180 start_codon:yes stop_codon:yes gene_type:complete
MKDLKKIYFKIFNKYHYESHINILKKTINSYISNKKNTKRKKNTKSKKKNNITHKITKL